MLVMPATNTVSEYSSALKPVIRSTFAQPPEARFNHLMLLHLHKELADGVDIVEVDNLFVEDIHQHAKNNLLMKSMFALGNSGSLK